MTVMQGNLLTIISQEQENKQSEERRKIKRDKKTDSKKQKVEISRHIQWFAKRENKNICLCHRGEVLHKEFRVGMYFSNCLSLRQTTTVALDALALVVHLHKRKEMPEILHV